MLKEELKWNEIKYTFWVPLWVVLIMTAIKIIEEISGLEFWSYGLLPRSLSGIKGILFSPFIHSDYNHLLSNIFPLFVSMMAILYFYRDVAWKVFVWVFLLKGVSVWFLGKDVYHVGASGLVYGFVTFLFFGGLLKQNRRLMALSLIMVFLYGGMIWGILPIQEGVSWESHLMGALAGIFCAVLYRNKGLKKEPDRFDDEDDDDGEDKQEYENWEDIYMRKK